MKQFKSNIKGGLKFKAKRHIKKIIQSVYMPKKDKGKKIYFKFLSKPVHDNYIFYEAFAGLGILDNPRALFQYMLSDPDFDHFIHIWSIDDIALAQYNIKEFENLSNVIIVKHESSAYYQYLATSKYLISNSTFGYYFEKRAEQVYINTWHGVPTKYMGYEHAVERVENARGPARNYLSADYIVSANRFMTNVMYRRAYKLDGLFQGNILETGHPRSDVLVNPDPDATFRKLNDIGIPSDKKIILYAPTWKGNLYNQLDYDVHEFKEIVKKLSEGIDSNNYRIYIRVHYFLYKILARDKELEKILIPFTIDTNELLSVVDVLISDYSSIFFDFLATKRPMLFYVPDLKNYETGRGLYVPIGKLPGLVSSNIQEIANSLNEICSSPASYTSGYQSLLDEMCQWCIYNDDGHSCERLVDIVFKKKEIRPAGNSSLSSAEPTAEKMLTVISGLTNSKKRLLICVNTKCNDDNFFENFKNTLAELDYETTDVTLLTTAFHEEKFKTYFNTLPYEIRILVWYALPFVPNETPEFFRHEVIRTLGNVSFDEVQIAGNITEYWAAFANAVPHTEQ